jgi:hypothetical protein
MRKAIFGYTAGYIPIFLLLFLIELFIALYVSDSVIRPFVGDLLVIPLVYTFVKIGVVYDSYTVILCVFLFACCIELLQAVHFLNYLGLVENKFLRIVLGNTFDSKDLFAYFLGYIIVYFFIKIDFLNSKS